MSGDADVIICENEPCAYQPFAREKGVETYEDDADVFEQIRVPRFILKVAAKQVAVVTMGEAGEIRFEIHSVLPIGDGPDAMILVVTTQN